MKKAISRRAFLRESSALSTLATATPKAFPSTQRKEDLAEGVLENATFQFTFAPTKGLKGIRLIHSPSGRTLAEGDYSFSCGWPENSRSSIEQAPGGSRVVSTEGTLLSGQVDFVHQIRIPLDKPWLEEQITLNSRAHTPVDLHQFRCGFVLPLSLSAGKVTGAWRDFKFSAIPFRREPNGNKLQYADFSPDDILLKQFSSELWTPGTTVTAAFASEGWAWTNGKQGFLISKYAQAGMEWAVLDRIALEGDRAGLRWGGCGIYRSNPEHGAWLLPGETHRFGVTRLTAYPGGMEEGFYGFREEMAGRGHGCPKGFNPPVHWNELYDNKLLWLPDWDNPEVRRKYYTLADMKSEAAKAEAIGCEALYLDPGWDTSFASKIWDESRLGTYKAFTEMLRTNYGLKSSLHTPLSGWCNPSSYPREIYRMDRFGVRLDWEKSQGHLNSTLCGASRQYVEETARRLKTLARDGAVYFMFDGTQYHGECWDPAHGHPVPARREEHVQSLCRLARMIHEEFPQVLIEMHDPVMGGTTERYVPCYYGHGRAPNDENATGAAGFDAVWAFELMWKPMEDLLSGRAIALYYYNLAYHLPLYIHVDLRTDNQNALVFWWNASTCRHLGIGGTHPDPAVQAAHKQAMTTYMRLQRFFKAGTFYGLGETVHVHVHPDNPQAVINCFNLADQPAEKEVQFIPAKVGLDPNRSYKIIGAAMQSVSGGYNLIFKAPAHGHALAEVSPE